MITEADMIALGYLFSRQPLNPMEGAWAGNFMQRLQVLVQPAEEEAEEEQDAPE